MAELISDRPTKIMLEEFRQLKEEFPDRVLIASIMEEYNKSAWEELVGLCEEAGVDAFEINFSCPHGIHLDLSLSSSGFVHIFDMNELIL